ncbi:MAG: protein kinase [Muribaculaceae bacterium]|nr:protein kinase [Muribaculaceae bacterium]
MESGFVSEKNEKLGEEWIPVARKGSSRLEFFKVRHYGALHFVKRPALAFSHDLLTVESLRKEFYIGYNLNHPSIVRYIRMEGDAVFEEYVDGLSLREMIDSEDERLYSSDFLLRICRQLLEATAYLHSQGVIHNDIKPENIMISRLGDRLKLVDLGCAAADMWDATEGFTPAYKAPEQGVGLTNVYTDIFLVGRLIDELANKAGVSRKWRHFIKRATSEEVSERFSSDAEALASVPELHRTKFIGFAVISFLLILIVAIGIFIIPGRRADVSDATEAVADSVAYTLAPVPMDTVLENYIGEEKTERSATPGSTSVSDLIDEELEKYVIDKYNNEVFPQCRKYAEMPDSYDKARLELQIQDIMASVIADVMEYAEKLAERKYPAEVGYARMRASALLNSQQTVAVMTQYPDKKSDHSSEDALYLDVDSLFSIYEEFHKK